MKTKILKNNVFWLKHIFQASKPRLFLNIFVTVIQSIFNFIFDVYIFLIVLDGWQNGEGFFSICYKVILIGIAHTVFLVMKNWYENCYVPQSDLNINQYMRKLIFKKMKDIDLYCYDTPDFYNGYILAMKEIDGRTNAYLNSINLFINNLFTISSTSFVIFTIDPIFFIIALIPLFVSFFIGRAQGRERYVYHIETQANERKKDYIRRIFYSKEYAEEMRTSGIFNVLIKHFDNIMNQFQAIIKRHGHKMALYEYLDYMLMDVIVYLGAVVIAVYKTVISKDIAVSGALVVANTIGSVSWSIRSFSDMYVEFQEHAMYIDNFSSFLNYKSRVNDEHAKWTPSPKSESLAVKNLTYTYPGNETPTLKNVCIDIRKGQKIAILGPNGSGKSTLMKVIMRYYEPDSGKIELDGKEISEYYIKDYRKNFGTVFQDYRLFAFTILDNLLLKDNIAEEERKRALYALNMTEMMNVIGHLPRGIDTKLTKEFDAEGVVLSGGEMQRLAVSRLFAKEYSFLFVDEPTSAMDPVTEYNVFKKILDYNKDKAVVFISHRLTSAVLADYIYYMDKGEIAEAGTHDELLALNGKYTAFWHKQAQLYGEVNRGNEKHNK